MKISLPPKLDALVKRKVRSGRYESAGEVIREGLRLLEDRERVHEIRLRELRKEVAVGVEQVRRGKVVRCQTDDEVAKFFAGVKSGGRRRARSRRGIA